jgi:hypothetical protein
MITSKRFRSVIWNFISVLGNPPFPEKFCNNNLPSSPSYGIIRGEGNARRKSFA